MSDDLTTSVIQLSPSGESKVSAELSAEKPHKMLILNKYFRKKIRSSLRRKVRLKIIKPGKFSRRKDKTRLQVL